MATSTVVITRDCDGSPFAFSVVKENDNEQIQQTVIREFDSIVVRRRDGFQLRAGVKAGHALRGTAKTAQRRDSAEARITAAGTIEVAGAHRSTPASHSSLIDVEDLSRLRARPHPFEVGVFRGFVFGLTLALLAALFLFLLFLFTSALSDSFFQVSSLSLVRPTGEIR